VAWEEPRLARFLTRLASFARLIVFDKRGTGMSDPVASPPSMDERMEDVGTALGAQAGEARLREIVTGAGFTSLRRVAETPFNIVLEARI